MRAYDYSNFERGVYTGMKWQVGGDHVTYHSLLTRPLTLHVPVCRVCSSLLDAHAQRTLFPSPYHSTFALLIKRPQTLILNTPNPYYSSHTPQGHPATRCVGSTHVQIEQRVLEEGRRSHSHFSPPPCHAVSRHIAGSYMNVPITAYANGGSHPPLAGDLLIYRYAASVLRHITSLLYVSASQMNM